MKGHFIKRGCKCGLNHCTCDKTWSFVIDIGKDPKTGKRQQKTRSGFKTRYEAEEAAATLITEVNQGTYIKESDTLFKDFVKEWLPDYINRVGPKPSTVRIRGYSIRKLLSYFAHSKLKDISEELYQATLNDLKNQDFSKSTLKGIHTTGKMIFKNAKSKRMIKFDPTENAYIIRDQQSIVESDEDELPIYFEKEELALFLDTVKEKGLYMDWPIFLTLAYTGMRVGELVALKWRNINFEKQTISITKTYYNPTNNTKEFQLLAPKTKTSRRTIIVDELVMDAFRKHKDAQEKLINRFGNSYYNEGYVFSNSNCHPGYPILIKLVESRMARLLKKTNLDLKVTPHSFRHTHTSLLAEAGVELEEIMDRLGHKDDEVTRNVYLHVTSVRKKGASNKFSNLMRGLTA